MPPLHIELQPMSDQSVFDTYCCLREMLEQFEMRYDLALRRYFDRHPKLDRPAQFDGEPF